MKRTSNISCSCCFAAARIGIFLAWFWLGGVPLTAQEPAQAQAQPEEAAPAEGPSGTNDVGQSESLTGDEQVSTNGTSGLTNITAGEQSRMSGREARERRFRRQRASQAGTNGAADSASNTNGSPVSLDYSAFKVVADRNIFNPNRRSGSRTGPAPPPREYLTLVGTMSYEKGSFAFFSGTDSKVAKLADSIAGFKVTNITPTAVKLESGTNEFDLRVGMQLRREEEGPWVVSSGPATYTASAAPATGSNTTSSSDAAESDIIKKLMARRAQE